MPAPCSSVRLNLNGFPRPGPEIVPDSKGPQPEAARLSKFFRAAPASRTVTRSRDSPIARTGTRRSGQHNCAAADADRIDPGPSSCSTEKRHRGSPGPVLPSQGDIPPADNHSRSTVFTTFPLAPETSRSLPSGWSTVLTGGQTRDFKPDHRDISWMSALHTCVAGSRPPPRPETSKSMAHDSSPLKQNRHGS